MTPLRSPFMPSYSGVLGVRPCYHARCKCCSEISTSNWTSHLKPGTEYTCGTRNVIYLIWCTYCDMGYVGQTTTPLRVRMNSHRFDIHHSLKRTVAVHFNRFGHTHDHFKVTILMIVDNLAEMNDWENYWIDRLDTRINGMNMRGGSKWIFENEQMGGPYRWPQPLSYLRGG